MMKIDPLRLEVNLKEMLAKNNRVLAIMKVIESSEIPPGKTALEMLAEELERQGLLKEVVDETAK
jgi:hypothetical protein